MHSVAQVRYEGAQHALTLNGQQAGLLKLAHHASAPSCSLGIDVAAAESCELFMSSGLWAAAELTHACRSRVRRTSGWLASVASARCWAGRRCSSRAPRASWAAAATSSKRCVAAPCRICHDRQQQAQAILHSVHALLFDLCACLRRDAPPARKHTEPCNTLTRQTCRAGCRDSGSGRRSVCVRAGTVLLGQAVKGSKMLCLSDGNCSVQNGRLAGTD